MSGRNVERRDLSFSGLSEVRAELERLEAAEAAGTLRTTGAWSAGQIFEHCSIAARLSFDGWGFRMPWHIRLFRPVFRRVLLGKKLPTGLPLNGGAAVLVPEEGRGFAEGIAMLRAQLDRLDAGEKMTAPSPLAGRLTHEQWTRIHLTHIAHHLSFVHG